MEPLGVVSALVVFGLTVRAIPFDRLPLKICILKRVTGIPCPSCGATRSFIHLVHGRIPEAFFLNPFWTLVMILGFGTFLVWALVAWLSTKGENDRKKISAWLSESHRKFIFRFLLGGLLLNWLYILVRQYYCHFPY
jgi:hypothetical protein